MSTNPDIKKLKASGDVVADLFCGGGGTTTGAKRALERIGYKFKMLAINHWNLSIESHTANHPEVEHYCQSIDTILPQELVPGRKLKLLLASPECTDHSNAKGGTPRSDQKRADAWLLMRWIEKLDVDTIIIENVKEFIKWGPLNKQGLPDKRKRGLHFHAFVEFLKISYTVEWRILNAADYGDATTRERFILIAKKGKSRKIVFPEPTHFSRAKLAKKQPDLFGKELKEWRSAASIIEWDRKGVSIFGRKKSLSPNSMKRIYAGLRKFSGIDLPDRDVYQVKSLMSFLPKKKREKASIVFCDQFAEKLANNKFLLVPVWECVVRDKKGKAIAHYQHPTKEELERRRAELQAPIDAKVRQTLIKIDWTKCKPFSYGAGGATGQQTPRDLSEPVRTITATPTFALVSPYTLQNEGFFRGNADGRDINEPVPTITQRGGGGVVEPFAINLKNKDRRMRSIKEPTFTQTTANHQYLCEPSVVTNLSHTGNKDESMSRSASEPLQTICGKGMLGLIESLPFMTQSYGEREGQQPRVGDINDPAWTITPQVRMNVVEPSLVKYYAGSDAVSVQDPMPTITANYEHLALATSFIASYHGGEDGDNRHHEVADPVPTIDTSNRFALSESFVVPCNHGAGDTRAYSIQEPVKTITQVDGFALVEPFLVIFKNNQNAQSIDEPLKTLTTKDSYGLVEIQIVAGENSPIPLNEVGLYVPYLGIILFVRFRMFAASELARAMGFPEGYYFAGTRQDQVTQIGNAVPCGLSEAVVYAAMKDELNKPKRKRAVKK